MRFMLDRRGALLYGRRNRAVRVFDPNQVAGALIGVLVAVIFAAVLLVLADRNRPERTDPQVSPSCSSGSMIKFCTPTAAERICADGTTLHGLTDAARCDPYGGS